MSRALTAAELAALERAWLLGTSRGPAPVPSALSVEGDDAGLVSLAFRAQQRQLTARPPYAREAPTPIELPDDPRPTFPDALRPALRRLFVAARARKQLDVMRPVAWWMRDAGVRLHPFDTFAMGEPSFRACAGETEAWFDEQIGRQATESEWLPEATDETWDRYGPATRQRWLEARRREDPDAARALLEACFSRERAEVRVRLLQALATAPVPEDRPFLEGLAKDRSKRVRELAAELLARVPGTSAHEGALGALRELLRVRRRRGDLTLQVAPGADVNLVLAMVSGFHPDTVASALGIDDETMYGAGDAPTLAPAFAIGALRHDDPAASRRFLAYLVGQPQPTRTWLGLLEGLPPRQVRTFAQHLLVDRAAAALLEAPDEAADWAEVMEGPLSEQGARALLESPAYRKVVAALSGEDGIDIAKALARVAVLIPPSAARDAAATLQAKGAMAAPLVQALWRLLAELNEVTVDPTASGR